MAAERWPVVNARLDYGRVVRRWIWSWRVLLRF